MGFFRINLAVLAWLLASSASWGQTDLNPSAAEEERRSPSKATSSTDIRSLEPREAEPRQPATPDAGVVGSASPFPDPTQRKLVSILKQKLPEQTSPFEFQDAPEWFQNMLQRIIRENIPENYVRDKDWGKTDKRWDGLDVERRGLLKWHTERKWKEVKHGTWKRYEVTQVAPEENLSIRLENIRDARKGKIGFDLRTQAKLHVDARMAKWTKGVQLYSINAVALADVELWVSCEVGMKLGLSFPPDVIFTPEVTASDLELVDFQLQKVSKLDGPLVKKMSGSVQRLLLEKIEEKRERLPEKINKQLAKHQDKMRLSVSEFVKSDEDQAE